MPVRKAAKRKTKLSTVQEAVMPKPVEMSPVKK